MRNTKTEVTEIANLVEKGVPGLKIVLAIKECK